VTPDEEKEYFESTSHFKKMGDSKMKDVSKNTLKSIVAQDASKMGKISKMSKKIDMGTNKQRKECSFSIGGVSHEIPQEKNYEGAIRAPTPTRENPPQGVKNPTEDRWAPEYPSTSSQQTGRGEAEQTPGGHVCCWV
jgi:hypothetical protein